MNYMKIFISFSLILLLISGCIWKKGGDDLSREGAEGLFELGNTKFNNGQYQEAIQTYELLLSSYPTSDLHIDTQLKIADSYSKLDKYEDQMDLLLRTLRENIIPERIPQIHVQLGKFYERAALFNPDIITSDTVDYKTAISYYEKAVKYTDSDDEAAKAEAQFRRALVEAKIGQINAAIEDYRTVTVVYPKHLYCLLAQIKLQDPNNTSELPIDELSLQSYRQQLNMPEPDAEPAEETTVPETTEQEVLQEDELFTPAASEDENIVEPQIEEPVDSETQPEIETTAPETSEADTTETVETEDPLFSPAPEDTTSN